MLEKGEKVYVVYIATVTIDNITTREKEKVGLIKREKREHWLQKKEIDEAGASR